MSEEHIGDEGYHRLANAIVISAAKDYRTVLRKCKRRNRTAATRKERKELEEFFSSDWFRTLTSVDGQYLMARLKKEAGYDK